MGKRGRPKVQKQEENPTKFTRDITYNDGVKISWTHDLSKRKLGPIMVELYYPKDYATFEEEQELIPPTQRKYLSPHTGKWVAYQRACALGLVEKKNK
jgi:hypothetical protein